MIDQPDPHPSGDTGVEQSPVRLRLADPAIEGRRLCLVDEHGHRFTLDITAEVRAAVRDDRDRRSHLENKMSSSIRPREIQTRIRAGESAESVAEAAATTVEAIMAYVGPVLAERQHIAARALRASLRRAPGEGGTSQTSQSRVLGDTVESHLRSLGKAPSDPAGTGSVAWDAYRRDTGRWVLTASFDLAGRSGVAHFTYDAPGNYALADDDDARWLLGELPVAAAETATPTALTRDDLQLARERRLAAVPADEAADEPSGLSGLAASVAGADVDGSDRGSDRAQASFSYAEELPLGGDTLDLLGERSPAGPAAPRPADEPLRATADQAPAATVADGDDPADSTDSTDRGRTKRPAPKKRGRASVPSWDEIMFGSSDQG